MNKFIELECCDLVAVESMCAIINVSKIVRVEKFASLSSKVYFSGFFLFRPSLMVTLSGYDKIKKALIEHED